MERIDRIEKAIEELVAAQKVTDVQLAKTEALVAGLSDSQRMVDVKFAELAESQKEMQRQLGGIGNTNGEFAENFFYSSLSNKMQLAGIKFDYIERNVKRRIRNLTDEFDIVLYNGDSIGLLEIKNTVKSANVKQLITSKVENFKILNPEYANHKIYLGVGGFTFENEGVKAEAKSAGVIVLEVQGDHFEADTENMRPY